MTQTQVLINPRATTIKNENICDTNKSACFREVYPYNSTGYCLMKIDENCLQIQNEPFCTDSHLSGDMNIIQIDP